MAAKKSAMSKIEDIFELIEMIFGGGLAFVKKKKKLHLVQQSCVWNQESKLIRLPVGNQHVILIYSVLRISLNNLLIPISSKLHFHLNCIFRFCFKSRTQYIQIHSSQHHNYKYSRKFLKIVSCLQTRMPNCIWPPKKLGTLQLSQWYQKANSNAQQV